MGKCRQFYVKWPPTLHQILYRRFIKMQLIFCLSFPSIALWGCIHMCTMCFSYQWKGEEKPNSCSIWDKTAVLPYASFEIK